MTESSSLSVAPLGSKEVGLSWLWEDRPGETVLPGPLYQKPLGVCRPLPAWEELARAVDTGSVNLDGRFSVTPSVVPVAFLQEQSQHGQSIGTAAASQRQRAHTSSEYKHASCRKGTTSHGHHRRRYVARPASTLTLENAEMSCVVPGSTAVWRGLGLPSSLIKRQCQKKEMARHCRDCKLERAAHDRNKSRRQKEDDSWLQPTVVLNLNEDEEDRDQLTSGRKHITRKVRIFDIDEDEPLLSSISPEPILPQISPQAVPSFSFEPPSEQKVILPKTTTDAKARLQMAMQLAALPTRHHMFTQEHLLEKAMLQTDTPTNKPKIEVAEQVVPTPSGESSPDFLSATTPKSRRGLVQRKQTGPMDDPVAKSICERASFPDEPDKPSEKTEFLKPASTLSFRRGTTFIGKADLESMVGKKGGKQSLLMRSRMRRLLDRRKQEFASWPSAEQARLRSAFQVGDAKGKAALDSKGLRRAFAGLGLEGRTPQEKEAIAKLAREAAIRGSINFFDFVFQLVPEVEHKLEELRSPKLYAEFQLIDTHGTGRIKEQQCLLALEKHTKAVQSLHKDDETFQSFWKQFVKDFPEIYKTRCQGVEQWLDFKGFQILATELDTQRANFQQQLEKRIANMTHLPAQLERTHAGELTVLKRVFDAHDVTDHGNLTVERAVDGLLQCGVAAPVGPLWDRMQKAMNEFEGMAFAFKDFLSLVDGMREETKTLLKAALVAYVKQLEAAGAPTTIMARDVPSIMAELPVCRDCCNNTEDLLSLVVACDKDSDELETNTLVMVISKVAERSRIVQREIEATTAKHLGFNAKQVMQLRESFASLTRTGVLGVEEVKAWFKEINSDVEPTTEDIEELIEEAAPVLAPPLFKPHSPRHLHRSDSNGKHADDEESGLSSAESDVDKKDEFDHLADAVAIGNIHSRHSSPPHQQLHQRASSALVKIDAMNAVKKAKDHHGEPDRNSLEREETQRSIDNTHSAAILGLDEDEEHNQKGSHLAVSTRGGSKRVADTNLGPPIDWDQRSSVLASTGNATSQATPKAQASQEPRAEELEDQDREKKEEDGTPKVSNSLNLMGGNLLYFDGFMRLISMIMKA